MFFTASLWGGFRSALKKCPMLGMGLDGWLRSRGDYTFVINVLNVIVYEQVRFVLNEKLKRCTFHLCGLWRHARNISMYHVWNLFTKYNYIVFKLKWMTLLMTCILIVSSFTSMFSIVLSWSGSSIHFSVHWGFLTANIEGKRTAQQCENDSNVNLLDYF